MKKLLLILFVFIVQPLLFSQEVEFSQLSDEEKLGQTLVAFVDIDSAEQVRPAIEAGKIGGVLIQWGNYSLAQTKILVEKLQGWAQKSPHKIPLLISIDYEGGTVYTPITLGFDYLPTNMMLSAADDEEGAAAIAYLSGLELKNTGIHINFSPVLDVNSNPSNPIIGVRSFGSNPESVTKMGLALISGFKAAGIMSIVKHFPGHGDTAQDSHYKVPTVQASLKQMQEIHLSPFQAAITHGVEGIMTGHVVYPALDKNTIATFSKPILQDLLRKKMGFKGLLVTDSLDMQSATSYCTISGCAIKAIENGEELILLGRYIKPLTLFSQISKGIEEKKLQKNVDAAALKIFDIKKKMGLFSTTENATAPATTKAYQAELEKISNKAVTLVRNEASVIPFKKAKNKPSVCAVFFAPSRFADQLLSFSQPFMEEGWNVKSYNAALSPKKKDIDRANNCAKNADLLVVTSLQWADKPNISQKNTIKELLKKYPNAILISTMSPYDIASYPEAKTLLATYGLNKFILKTAANIILGKQPALGHLPIELKTK